MKKIGILVDGESEFASISSVLNKLDIPGVQILKPLRPPIQPLAPIGTTAGVCKPHIRQLSARGVSKVIVLLDREDRADCPGMFASELQEKLNFSSDCEVFVVLKDRAYENWLIADVAALRASPARFAVTSSFEKKVQPNRADSCDGYKLLNQVAKKGYSKIRDSELIMAKADPLEVARHSRSFRRLLRVLEHDAYQEQSRRPAK